ncbi:TRAP-type C4-dicarboxylate transport system, substrate-binding protein [Fulvimarina manganoxydans]|uniref:TRAP-type C4-dicarboxylate transport system, substrate-binding protein n=1 Tax=Fulvimarina manganoxydans TaxID=937218 RepID=A0A1W2EPV4_9HYPH|nr:TRAP transporter substrate-binding protein [Fulvimarina manganoxydans]SMD11705.1 TRAP-type C4-dicarboxylate transport system, substrate-binding protein [Fulvimarina manganoxydans]
MTANDKSELENHARRNFMKLTAAGSFTAALVAGAAGTLWSDEAAAQSANEEREREAAAEQTMTIGTAYVLGASRSYPIMQLDLKENIQNLSGGRIYVKLAPGGQLGAGGALVQKVQSNTIQAAQHSISNFAPFAPAVDLINLPYFCGSNQRFVNLVKSDAWRSEVHPKIEERGFKPLFYVVIDPRVVALRQGEDKPVLSPGDLQGIKFRVPGSEMLQQYYRMVGANPTPVAWGETPSAIKQGVADALDPAVGALYVFGFKDILSHVTFTQAVPDAQIYSCNLEWFNGLSDDLKQAIEMASEITSVQNLAKVPAARAYAMYEMQRAGVEFHTLDDAQLAEWKEAGGYQRSEWDGYKADLAGSMDAFAKLDEAAGTQGKYAVNDA